MQVILSRDITGSDLRLLTQIGTAVPVTAPRIWEEDGGFTTVLIPVWRVPTLSRVQRNVRRCRTIVFITVRHCSQPKWWSDRCNVVKIERDIFYIFSFFCEIKFSIYNCKSLQSARMAFILLHRVIIPWTCLCPHIDRSEAYCFGSIRLSVRLTVRPCIKLRFRDRFRRLKIYLRRFSIKGHDPL